MTNVWYRQFLVTREHVSNNYNCIKIAKNYLCFQNLLTPGRIIVIRFHATCYQLVLYWRETSLLLYNRAQAETTRFEFPTIMHVKIMCRLVTRKDRQHFENLGMSDRIKIVHENVVSGNGD